MVWVAKNNCASLDRFHLDQKQKLQNVYFTCYLYFAFTHICPLIKKNHFIQAHLNIFYSQKRILIVCVTAYQPIK
ncbi:hypothetical protein ATPR_0495 [Acetobacter tropicalis NBRC 101654]|uniref:Uncharacterized protein n=1 Tax=Acetobacter tropicalis NBRC 101654 TaxID=749388 RepID=F7VAU6_9PROT|nr:hypothetical protein ATPR_0495 [Acetobacter tropicalis NBRC 101654]